MSVNTNLVELLNYVSPYAIDGEHSEGMLARFKVGQSYGVNDNNLKSNGVQLAFTVNKNTHKSVNITVYEKYNGVVTVKENIRKNLNCGGHGFWVTVDGVKYATVELFDAASLSRWAKGHINVLNTKEVDLNDFTSCDNFSNAEKVEKVEKVLDFTPVFYEIDEKMARLAREMNSFREYEENSTTEYYKARVKEVFSIAEKNHSEKSLYLANVYAKKYAEYINNSNRVNCLCPSIMISGAGNFNTRKKEKQNARRENLSRDFEKLQNLLEKIKRPDGWGYAEIKRDTITANEFDGVQFFKVVINEEVNRLQLVDFEEIPTDEQKSVLKRNGFKWSPRFQAWQRQLTENAINGVWRVVREFERLENEEIEELHATIQENKPVENAEPVEVESVEPVAEVENAEPVEPVQEALTRNEMISILNRLLRTYYNNKLVDLLSTFSDKQLKTIYIMLLCYGSSIWVKDDKVRLYLNNGFNFVKTEKLELIKPNVWVGKNKFDWYKWEVNGLQTYEVFKHSKDDKAYCCKLSNEFIELNLYYDVINNKFVFEDDIFNVTKTVIEKIKSDVKDIELLPVEEVENAEPVEPVQLTIDNNTPDLIKSVVELEKVKKSDNVISEKSKEFLKEFNALSKDIIENTVDNVMKTIEKAEPVEEVKKVGLDINTSYPEPVQIDINTSYPELQCFEDIEKVEKKYRF